MVNLTQPKFGGKGPGMAENGKRAVPATKDKSGFGKGTVDPGLRTPFVDAVFKK